MVLDLERYKKKQKESESGQMGNFFKPKAGRNVIRVFTFQHKVTDKDVKAGFFEKKLLGKTVDEIDRPVKRFMRSGMKPVLYRTEGDELNLEYLAAVKKKGRANKEVRMLAPSTQYFMNVVDVDNPSKGVMDYACSKTVYHEILGYVMDDDYGIAVLGCEGRDFVIEYDPNAEGTDKYHVKIRPENKCDELPEELQETVRDFYDPEIEATLGDEPSGAQAEGESEDEDDEEEDNKESSEEEDEDELEDEEDEEEGEEDKPKKKSKSEDDNEDEDLDDEDEDEEEVKPKKKKKAKK